MHPKICAENNYELVCLLRSLTLVTWPDEARPGLSGKQNRTMYRQVRSASAARDDQRQPAVLGHCDEPHFIEASTYQTGLRLLTVQGCGKQPLHVQTFRDEHSLDVRELSQPDITSAHVRRGEDRQVRSPGMNHGARYVRPVRQALDCTTTTTTHSTRRPRREFPGTLQQGGGTGWALLCWLGIWLVLSAKK